MGSHCVFFCIWLLLLNSMFVKFVYDMACSYSLFSSLCSRRSTSCFVNKVLLRQGQAHLLLYCLQLLSHHNGRVGLQRRPYSGQIFALWHLTEKHSCTCLLVDVYSFLLGVYTRVELLGHLLIKKDNLGVTGWLSWWSM